MKTKKNQKQEKNQKDAIQEQEPEFLESVVNINRVAKVVKGGRRFSLTALVVAGNRKGKVGYGSGKGKEVPDAINKASKKAKDNMVDILIEGSTIPYEVMGVYCSSRVLLKPAVEGTGVIAGAAVRAVVEGVGIHNIVTKSMGSDNTENIVKATFEALKLLRSKKDVEKLRGVTL